MGQLGILDLLLIYPRQRIGTTKERMERGTDNLEAAASSSVDLIASSGSS
jgi:hypothetical protein